MNKDTSVYISIIGQEGLHVSEPHIQNKEENKIVSNSNIVVSRTDV